MAFRVSLLTLIFIAFCGRSTADKCCYSSPKDCDHSDDWCSQSVEHCKSCDGFIVADTVSDGTSAGENTTKMNVVTSDSSARDADKSENSVASSAGDTEPLMLVAASPGTDASDDAGAESDAVSPDSEASNVASEPSHGQIAAEEKMAWCQREYVSAKDCDSWVADQMARKAARKADERKRHEERRKDEEARHQARLADHRQDSSGSNANEEDPLMLVAMSSDSDASDGAGSKCCYSDSEDCDSSDDWCSKTADRCKNCGGFFVADTATDVSASASENTTSSNALASDSSVGGAPEAENSVASSVGDTEPLMLAAASPEADTSDDAGAESDSVSTDSESSNDASEPSNGQTAAEEKLAWCQREYVSAKDCDSWVADQMARKAARKADERKRREERRKDEEARHQARLADKRENSVSSNANEEEPLMLAATSPSAFASDDADAESVAMSPKSEASNGSPEASNAATDTEEKLAWCQREYVSANDCDSWVADQMARKAARKADERKRREERRKDEETRRQARLADEREKSVGSSATETEPLILVATSPSSDASDDADAESDAVSPDSDASAVASEPSNGQTAAEQKLAWCQREYVSAKECNSWVADQMARKAARKADERKRREERRKDEEARRQARFADERENSVGSSTNEEEPLILVATSPSSDASDGAHAGKDAYEVSNGQSVAEEKLAWCQREYVSAKDCDLWVADQMARKAARKADERKRREERRKDEEARHQARLAEKIENSAEPSGFDDAGPVMLPALGPQHAIAFLVSFIAGATIVALSARASIQLRFCRNRAQVALLDDVAHV